MDYTPDPAEGQRVYDLDRAHVFHSWSAQAQIKPLPIAASYSYSRCWCWCWCW
jgi:taurine--2-oxoglutarate transaminase